MIGCLRLLAAAVTAGLALVSLAGPGAAQSALSVRAGDQPGLSRLVLDLPPGTQWLLEQEARQVIVRFPAVALDFDTEAVFPGRQASRVLTARSRAEATGTVMLLTLACDCSAEAFTLGPRTLVVDLRDQPPADRLDRQAPPPPRPTSPATEPGPTPGPIPGSTPAADLTAAPTPATAVRPTTAPTDPSPAALEPAISAAIPATTPPVLGTAPSLDPGRAPNPETARPASEIAIAPPGPAAPEPQAQTLDPDTAAEIEKARTALLARLAQAAEEGLVDLRPPDIPPSPAPVAEAATPEAAPPPPPPPQGPGIDVRTSRDSEPDRSLVPRDPRCVPDAALALADWALPGQPAEQIATARAGLIGEFDRVDAQALIRLAQVYIQLGFGREAEMLLTVFASELRDTSLLIDLARVIESRAVPEGSDLLQVQGCPGRAALWTFLATLDPTTDQPPSDATLAEPEEMLAALAELGGPARRLVGPRLARGFLALGRLDLAEGALLRVIGAPGDPGDEYRLAEAAFLDAEGRHDKAEAIWRALIAHDRPYAARAMIALSESRRARGLDPPDGLADDLAARAFATRRSPDGVRLRLAEVETRAAAGDLAMALGLLRRELSDRPEREAELRSAAAWTMARARPDRTGTANYAAAVLAFEDLLARDASADPARLVLAGEMTALGLPNAALRLLAPPLARDVTAARLTAARAELDLATPAAALTRLEGVESRNAALLRAEAHALTGAYPEALAALPADAAPELAAFYAFAAGDWDRVAGLDDPVGEVLAAYMAGLAPDEFVAPPAERTPAADPNASPETQPPSPATAEAPDPAQTEALAQFLEPPRLTEPISLDLAREAVEMARNSRELLRTRINDPDG
ncbi:MAG: hypothetical protein AAGE13_09200 [Pseudomonadota bacterium]